MDRVFYNKLIRDKIPETIAENGGAFDVRKIEDDAEFEQELLKKVAEEGSALARVRTREEFLDEYADLAIVLRELMQVMGFTKEDEAIAIKRNLERKGGFAARLFLAWSSGKYTSNETPQGVKRT
jgi:predicted house-cleaning noncanonical NTP pyrophosphatase (MazG superfamily)